MKIFLDTEFIEGVQDKTFLGFTLGKTKPTIDLISLGLVSEDDKEYYAVSKDFNLKEAWNRYQQSDQHRNGQWIKDYWIRDNVLRPIYNEFLHIENNFLRSDYKFDGRKTYHTIDSNEYFNKYGTLKELKRLINKFGKTNNQIAKELKEFIYTTSQINNPETIGNWDEVKHLFEIEFYADFCNYDWVVFCWLFGKMNDLPTGFPYYCNDLQQIKEAKWNEIISNRNKKLKHQGVIKHIDEHPDFPKQNPAEKHHALNDARYDKDLFNFIKSL
jgi:hypothetical protein